MDVSSEVEKLYGYRVRLRVCGVCIEKERILLVRHSGLSPSGHFWIPPGGGVQFGSGAEENLVREFEEETGLRVRILRFLFACEYIGPPVQTVELFFEVSRTGGMLRKGTDPEMPDNQQIIDEVRFVSFEELRSILPENVHYMLRGISCSDELLGKVGFFKFEKN